VQENTAKDWFDKGMVLANQHKYHEAIEAFDKATEINPQYNDARCNNLMKNDGICSERCLDSSRCS
jgi:hypothetical protein